MAGLPSEFDVDADIRRARLPPGAFYTDPRAFAAVRERVFARSWHLVGHERELAAAGARRPFTLLPGLLDEPLLLTRAVDGGLAAQSRERDAEDYTLHSTKLANSR
jgi:hypothetical protein